MTPLMEAAEGSSGRTALRYAAFADAGADASLLGRQGHSKSEMKFARRTLESAARRKR